MKACAKCHRLLALSCFGKHYAGVDGGRPKDGLQSWCKVCCNEAKRLYKLNNKTKTGVWNKAYVARNRSRYAGLAAKRRATKLNATPKWLNPTHLEQLAMFYEAANNLSKEFCMQMDVDHIVPLQGKEVSGLHVPWNLQVLPHTLNIAKGNR